MVGAAELGEVKVVTAAFAIANGHLVVVAEPLVYIGDELLLGEVIAYAARQLALVVRGVEEYGIGGLSIASGTSGLLVVGFGRIGHLIVYDHAHVGLVDTHAEGVGGYHGADGALGPLLLTLVLVACVESCVVVGGADVVCVE